MNFKTLIDETANRADEVLGGCTNPSEARVIILELLATEHPEMSPSDRQKIAEQAVAILDNEGFFESDSNASSWGENDDEAESVPDDQ